MPAFTRAVHAALKAWRTESIPQIDPVNVPLEKADRHLVLLDVRRDDEFATGHAPGALHIPLDDLAQRVGELSRTTQIACICRSGARSTKATELLRPMGYSTSNVSGGMLAWATAGLRVEASDGTPGSVL
jgi:rhodanese-related sulfurtransferase